jgi:hypothetical protein
LTPVTAIKLKFNLSDNEFKYCFNTLYNDWKHLIMWLFQLLLIIASSAWYNLVFDEFKDISKMHRESTKVTVMSRWPLYKGDRYDRFDCILDYICHLCPWIHQKQDCTKLSLQ